ncbi:DUF3240 family protein [Colwellia psychrerythraea]|uniref:DUF3240 domain-containing protein n=1 Tax=Colwellia psychrerythraea TaxID=28229 RepID=A0A099KC03_COLPS|nr:DUF3240 family protein [Colwellia psychrerythraea]KGJ87557.1 Protein of unknown function DUF3240 [Colwellia psychrerythraea]
MPEQVIFTLNVPTELKDDVIDNLITFTSITGFNLKKINGYSKEHSQFDIAEQVAGYRAIYQIEVLIALKEVQHLKASLNPICQPAKLKYWLTPVIESAHF